ncbi:CRISPR-associated endonuclease Cas3'' [Starkeya koreensis]|uniref:CRISPR-associated endonuclease Cas3 n=1 Tax=Ancylobacter koreensis TaxID=266121 RepID=A0ABT0DHE3_9HYPH|nr:CRISPR-associated endonuclease Cas3'' [Ancylobacter koreensis]MCK0206696.1 CRISPR-associated endonuclease Cas3'' [Ancylobacter koreensis]
MAAVHAHSLAGRPRDEWETLAEHSAAVGALAASFAEPLGWAEVLRLAATLHDIGKASPEFQAYIAGERFSGGDHSSAGARIALDHYGKGPGRALGTLLAAIIAAHHAGLADGSDLNRRMEAAHHLVPADWQHHAGALPDAAALTPRAPPPAGGPKGFAWAFLLRMLFSCLVDADFIATEGFYARATGERIERGNHTDLVVLRDRLAAFMAEKRASAPSTPLNALRAGILDHAMAKAALPPGLFSLTVPTGGGKTLASLSFALEHAVRHGLRRVILVIPYTSIIEQSAQVFREALGAQDDVLEHHASFDWEAARGRRAADDEAPDALAKLQRAAENWDVPIVVTTAVQFFESLFANRTSRCRKLHNIAGSVVVLDEVQTLPLPLLLPSLAAIEQLALNYRTSVILCTATQPALRRIDGALLDAKRVPLGLDLPEARELAPDPAGLYARLRRVAVERRTDPVPDATIAARFAEQPQMLCIVNTRGHARALFDAIRALPGAVHLSTLMCARHRRRVLADLRAKLKAREPVRLVATSLIEAGVDISFPEVWRAAAGIDAIAQAAGRCNREGELKDAAGTPGLGRVVVFEPAEGHLQHDIRLRWQAAQPVFDKHADPLGLDAVKQYFAELYWQKGEAAKAFDAAKVEAYPGILPAIGDAASGLDSPFRSIAEAFRMIDEEAMEPVVVPWKADPQDDDARSLLARIAAAELPRTADLRRLQQYVVPIPKKARDEWLLRGVLTPVHRSLGEAMLRFADDAHYRPETGVDLANMMYRDVTLNDI